MKIKRTVVGPVLVALAATVSGGWLLQRGVAEQRGVHQQAQILNEVLQYISTRYVDDISAEELYRKAIRGLLTEIGDPHTSFLSVEDYNELRTSTTGEYGGLGIQISQRHGWITIIAPLPGTPAERAGLMPGDRIVEIDGTSTEGWSDEDAVRVLRGPKGAAVDIKIARVGVAEPIPYRLVRDEIQIQSVPYAYMVAPGVGYTRLTMFRETSTDELRVALDDLRRQGATGMILDLRTNPGGLLDQGVSVADLFTKRGDAIVETRGRDVRVNETFRARSADQYPGIKLVVLVDGFSASAAEIVAGALQDHDRALVLGTTSFGKGSVQSLLPLSGGNFLKVTTGRWYTPVGRLIEKEGRQAHGDPMALLEDEPIAEDGHPVALPSDEDTVPPKPYRTDSGRIVYGGGGIVPDLVIRPDTLTLEERAFFQTVSRAGATYNDVLFRYAIEYGRQNPGLSQNFEVTAQMRSEFVARLRAANIEVTDEQVLAAASLIDQRLGQEITQHKFGLAAAAQRANAEDPLVRTAIEMLRSASDQQALFQAAQRRAQARS
jgi:carboxyl-terminal processing protease